MAFWPYWQLSSNKLVIFIISSIFFYVFCLRKINSSSSSLSLGLGLGIGLARPTGVRADAEAEPDVGHRGDVEASRGVDDVERHARYLGHVTLPVAYRDAADAHIHRRDRLHFVDVVAIYQPVHETAAYTTLILTHTHTHTTQLSSLANTPRDWRLGVVVASFVSHEQMKFLYVEPSQYWDRWATVFGLMKFGHLVFEMREQTDRQTDVLITILRTPPGGEGIKR